MASDFIGKLKCKELESNERKSRVPFLACLHLEKMTLDKRIHASSTGNFTTRLGSRKGERRYSPDSDFFSNFPNVFTNW